MKIRKCPRSKQLPDSPSSAGCSPAAAAQTGGCASGRSRGGARRHGRQLFALVVFAVACGDEPTSAGVDDDELPAVMELNGSAFIELDDGRTADCAIFLRIERADDGTVDGVARVYRGTAGGDATRTVLDETGAGFSFWPHLHSGATIRATPDSIEVIADGAETEAVRFYRGIMHFSGERTGRGEANGTWTCAPLDLDQNGWLDTAIVAPGTWTITTADS